MGVAIGERLVIPGASAHIVEIIDHSTQTIYVSRHKARLAKGLATFEPDDIHGAEGEINGEHWIVKMLILRGGSKRI